MNQNATGQHLEETTLEAAVIAALATPPAVTIPNDFAARVARRAAAQQPRPRTHLLRGWGPRLALGSAALVTVAMFALAPHALPSLSDFRFDAELVLLTELSGLLLFSRHLLSAD